MRYRYTAPYCEIVKLSFTDIVCTSGDPPDIQTGSEETPVVRDSAAGAVIYKSAYMNNVVHGLNVDPGDIYDPFYNAPHSFSGASNGSDTDEGADNDMESSTRDPYSGYNTDTDLSESDSDLIDDIW